MTHIILDTETTGIMPEQGHRICELAQVTVTNGVIMGHLTMRFNPERELDPAAAEVNGLSWAMLRKYPKFAQCADAVAQNTAGAHLVIHNAPFDVGFLDAEFQRVYPNWPGLAHHAASITCTLRMAQDRLPGIRHSLNNLCDHYGIYRGDRDAKNHDALTDCLLLAQVYHKLQQEPQQ